MIQLRVRTEYSFNQTFAPMGRVIERLKATGCRAAGIVDRSSWGHVAWAKACRAAGIKPLFGMELVVSEVDDSPTRMWFLARSQLGLQELYRAASAAHRAPLQTKYGQLPRLRKADVLALSDEVAKFAGDILDADFLVAAKAILDLSPASALVNRQKLALATGCGLPVVNTSDNAYAFPEDAGVFKLVVRRGTKVTPQHLLDAIEETSTAVALAELPDYPLPVAPMIEAAGDLEALCREGIKARGLDWPADYEARMMYELELIRSKNFESYFIIVADMVRFAKEHMLVGPSRGSAAGSLVCYLLRITEIDPIPPKLFFERFIDVSRSDLPDIDLDFPDNKRHLVFEYMAEKYGAGNVGHIGTISRYKPKSALIHICKALDIPPSATGAIKVAMIERSSADARASNCLADTFETTEPGKEFIKQYPEAEAAKMIEAHASHTGVHAAGLLVSKEPITNYAVIDADGIAHIEKGAAEELGLLKIDVLGLRTLGVLEDAQVGVDWYNLPFDDAATFEIFNSGRLCGIFQFEGNALRAISRDIEFSTIADIDAVTALARPGPFIGGVTEAYIKRRNGEKYQPIHALVEQHMSETYGLPVYQEQTLAIVKEIGQFDWKETSIIRKAMSKSMGKEFFDSYWPKFKKGAEAQGISEEAARKTWEMINAMGSWQMNKAHTYSYAVISYWTAYLKANFPLEFAAANLRNAKDDDSAIQLLREMTKEGIDYVAFDLEKSEVNWCAKDGMLYGGFTSLKGIGEISADKLVEARNAGKLDKKQREKIEKAESPFADIFPIETQYGGYYREPKKHGVIGEVHRIVDVQDVPHKHERVFIGELVSKSARSLNEEVLIKKRGGKVEKDLLEFVDMRIRDDTDVIGARIGRYDYQAWGKKLVEDIPIGAKLLVRAKFFNGIRYAFVTKWKRLDEEAV